MNILWMIEGYTLQTDDNYYCDWQFWAGKMEWMDCQHMPNIRNICIHRYLHDNESKRPLCLINSNGIFGKKSIRGWMWANPTRKSSLRNISDGYIQRTFQRSVNFDCREMTETVHFDVPVSQSLSRPSKIPDCAVSELFSMYTYGGDKNSSHVRQDRPRRIYASQFRNVWPKFEQRPCWANSDQSRHVKSVWMRGALPVQNPGRTFFAPSRIFVHIVLKARSPWPHCHAMNRRCLLSTLQHLDSAAL